MAAGESFLVKSWYSNAPWLYLLWPVSLLFLCLLTLRRWFYDKGLSKSCSVSVPVIIVGNISVGGTGKTPLVVALIERLQKAGLKPGIVSRGYGSQASIYPFHVEANHEATVSGDEPLLIAQRTGVPVVIDANRCAAAQSLLEKHPCDVIISDDGMQHYSLQRDIEIAVIDGKRGLGNGLCLPAGPLREPSKRLASVNYVITNGKAEEQANVVPPSTPSFTMSLQATSLNRLDNKEQQTVADWNYSMTVHAVAGIGNPERFYNTLRKLGFTVIEHSFADHHAFTATDLSFNDELPIIMTEKDAVKIRAIASLNHCWYLPVDASIDESFFLQLIKQLQTLMRPE